MYYKGCVLKTQISALLKMTLQYGEYIYISTPQESYVEQPKKVIYLVDGQRQYQWLLEYYADKYKYPTPYYQL